MSNKRILIVDDNRQIHEVLKKILNPPLEDTSEVILELETYLFEDEDLFPETPRMNYQIDSAFQGQEGIEKVQCSLNEKSPYALAFVDMRMPPGIDGLETIKRFWELDPNLEIVICSAYSDYSWDEIIQELGETEQLIFLSKPFTTVAAQQMALSQVRKWELKRHLYQHVDLLESTLNEQTGYVNLIKKVAMASNRASSIEEAAQHILKHVCQYTGWPLGVSYLLDNQSVVSSYSTIAVHCEASIQDVEKHIWDLAQVQLSKNLIQLTEQDEFKAGKIMSQSLNIDSEHPLYSLIQNEELRSMVTIPICKEKEPLAFLNFYSRTDGELEPQWLDNFSDIAFQLSLVIERIWQVEKLKIQIELLQEQLSEKNLV